ncbi:hypothetical protein, partial [Xanthomonas euvesicatoria]|uniref:hypothetical protein n=1 Tax=Xanthomonas euvesicatoria TaxID=456327 RepID=UPI001C48C2E9
PLSSVININRRPLVLAGIELRGVDRMKSAVSEGLVATLGRIIQWQQLPAHRDKYESASDVSTGAVFLAMPRI